MGRFCFFRKRIFRFTSTKLCKTMNRFNFLSRDRFSSDRIYLWTHIITEINTIVLIRTTVIEMQVLCVSCVQNKRDRNAGSLCTMCSE